MSISSATWSLRKCPVWGTNDFILSVTAIVTGDGSGGTISATNDIVNILPADCTVWIMDAGFYNNSAASELLSCEITSTDWEAGISGTIVAGNAANTLTRGDSYYVSSINHHNQTLPAYLGRRAGSAATLSVKSNTNTNTKAYGWWFVIKICPKMT